MTTFVGVDNMAAWARSIGVERVITEMSRAVEDNFARWEQFDLVPRLASHSSIGVIELMPASDGTNYAFKYVNGHPTNPVRGFQTVVAFGALADSASGYPILVAEMTLLTALRTAATSAMASRLLARPDSTTMALIGAGSQAEFQALGHRAALGINELRVWDIDAAAMRKAERNLNALGFRTTLATSAEDAVRGCDLVTTCTADKVLATVLFDAWLQPGVHLNAIGGDCPGKTELESAVLDRSTVFVEYEPQTRVEGEIQRRSADFAVTELWQVVQGRHVGRSSDEEVTLFDSVGFAIEDFAALRYLNGSVRPTGHYVDIDLIVEPDDPKDLFGIIGAPVPVA